MIDISAVHQYFWFSSPSGHTLHVSIPLKLPMAVCLALANKMRVDLMCRSDPSTTLHILPPPDLKNRAALVWGWLHPGMLSNVSVKHSPQPPHTGLTWYEQNSTSLMISC